MMRIEALDRVKANAAESFRAARRVYETVLGLTGENSVLLRLRPLFDPATFASGGARPQPYETVVPFVKASFDDAEGFSAEFSHAVDRDGLAPGDTHRPLRISLDADKRSQWFALEIQIPWSEIRTARELSMTVFGSASGESYLDLQIFYRTVDGERCEWFTDKPSATLTPEQSAARMDVDIVMPDVQIDFEQEPELAVFLNPAVSEFVIEDWFIGFERS